MKCHEFYMPPHFIYQKYVHTQIFELKQEQKQYHQY